jgi:hypothetical protein
MDPPMVATTIGCPARAFAKTLRRRLVSPALTTERAIIFAFGSAGGCVCGLDDATAPVKSMPLIRVSAQRRSAPIWNSIIFVFLCDVDSCRTLGVFDI